MAIYSEEENPNVIAYNNQSKNDIIQKIKTILDEFGGFDIVDVQTSYFPQILTNSNLIHLIEVFYLKEVQVYVYDECKDNVVDNYTLPYENLTIDNLEYILKLVKEWEEINLNNNE